MDGEKILLDILPRGEGNAIKQSEITALTGYPPRETRLIVERLRKQGTVICASDSGRFIPETLYELERYIKREQSAILNQQQALQSALDLRERWTNNDD